MTGATDTAARERLTAWTEDFSIGRYHLPTYKNPGELKADIRELVSRVAQLENVIECADTPLMRDVLTERDAANARVQELEAALGDIIARGETRRVHLHIDGREEWAVPIIGEVVGIARAALSAGGTTPPRRRHERRR